MGSNPTGGCLLADASVRAHTGVLMRPVTRLCVRRGWAGVMLVKDAEVQLIGPPVSVLGASSRGDGTRLSGKRTLAHESIRRSLAL